MAATPDTGFFEFLRNFAQIPVSALPDNSPYIYWAYDAAFDYVNDLINTVAPFQYSWALYNLTVDNLINWCPDQTGSTFFADARKAYNISQFTMGTVSSSTDEGTSATLNVPEFMKNLTMADLQRAKTPYGREYMAIAQTYGTNWGLT